MYKKIETTSIKFRVRMRSNSTSPFPPCGGRGRFHSRSEAKLSLEMGYAHHLSLSSLHIKNKGL